MAFSLSLLLLIAIVDGLDDSCCPADGIGCVCVGKNQVECDGLEAKDRRNLPHFKRVPNYCRFKFKSLELRDYFLPDHDSAPTLNFHQYQIETLRLSYNSIKLRHGHIFEGPCENSTKHLQILGAKLTEVPSKAIGKLKRLESLFIESVKIVVPHSFRYLQNLEFLGLANLHGFLQLYPSAFEGLPNMRRLVLHPSDLILFQEKSLAGLSRLTSLHLSLLIGSDISEELSRLHSLTNVLIEVIYPVEWLPTYHFIGKCFNLIPLKCKMFPRMQHVVIKNGICTDLLERLLCKRPANLITLELFLPKEILVENNLVEVNLHDIPVHNLSIEVYHKKPTTQPHIRDLGVSLNHTDNISLSVQLKANANLRQLTYGYPAALNLSFVAKTPQLRHLTISSAADLLPLGLLKLINLRSLRFSHLDQFARLSCNCSNFWITRYPRWEDIVEPQVKCLHNATMSFRDFLNENIHSGTCESALELSFKQKENLAYDLELAREGSMESVNISHNIAETWRLSLIALLPLSLVLLQLLSIGN